MRVNFKVLIFLGLLSVGCTSVKFAKQDSIGFKPDQKTEPSLKDEAHGSIMSTGQSALDVDPLWHITSEANAPLNLNVTDSSTQTIDVNEEPKISLQEFSRKELGVPENLGPISPVARKIVENYLNSKNKQPGGHCLTVSRYRFEKAYQDVYKHSVYEDLPDSLATPYYTPKEAFDFLYVSASGIHEGWQSLPMGYRGKGNAGAIAYAGMGILVGFDGIWNGELSPGAMMQVWKHQEDYDKVVVGTNNKDFDPFGHSFIFMGYVRDEYQKIIGIRIADQGYQSYRTLIPTDYEVWWAVNLVI